MKAAIDIAKAHLGEVFADESIGALRLEEVWFDEPESHWCVTLGFLRQSDPAVAKATGTFARYEYKVVRIDDRSGRAISIRNREAVAA